MRRTQLAGIRHFSREFEILHRDHYQMVVQLLLLQWMNVARLSVVFVGKGVTSSGLYAELILSRDDLIHFLLS